MNLQEEVTSERGSECRWIQTEIQSVHQQFTTQENDSIARPVNQGPVQPSNDYYPQQVDPNDLNTDTGNQITLNYFKNAAKIVSSGGDNDDFAESEEEAQNEETLQRSEPAKVLPWSGKHETIIIPTTYNQFNQQRPQNFTLNSSNPPKHIESKSMDPQKIALPITNPITNPQDSANGFQAIMDLDNSALPIQDNGQMFFGETGEMLFAGNMETNCQLTPPYIANPIPPKEPSKRRKSSHSALKNIATIHVGNADDSGFNLHQREINDMQRDLSRPETDSIYKIATRKYEFHIETKTYQDSGQMEEQSEERDESEKGSSEQGDNPPAGIRTHEKQKDKNKNQTKNIPKNYGKAIISFVETHKLVVEKLTKNLNVNSEELIKYVQEKKRKVNTIADLRTLWNDEPYAKSMRILSNFFLRKHSLQYIFHSRISNYNSHIKYRSRLMEALINPAVFSHIKHF